jgi:predicted transposase YdaD
LATAEDNGKQIGRAEEKIEIAHNALQMKMTVADIVKLTGLTCEEVENLHKEM